MPVVRGPGWNPAPTNRWVADGMIVLGLTGSIGIAKALTDRGIASPRGGYWGAQAVADVLSRAA